MSLQVGQYKGRAVKGSFQFGNSNGGGDQASLDLDLGNGVTVTTILSFGGKAEEYSIERLRACGWDGSSDFNAGIDANEVDVDVTSEVYEGKERLRVQIRTAGRFAFKAPMNPSQAASFQARIAAKAKQSAPQNASKDIPF